MDPFIINGEKDKAKVITNTYTKEVTVTYKYWNKETKETLKFSFDEIGFAVDGYTIIMKNDTNGMHVFNCLGENYKKFKPLVEKHSRGKKMCVEFLRKFCNVTPEDEKKYNFFEDMRRCTERDPPLIAGKTTFDPPVGWYRLNLNPAEEMLDWDYGYHGTRAEFVGSILRNRLVVPGNKTEDGTLIKVLPTHIPGRNQIYTSPSLHYSGHYIYAKPTEFHYTDDDGSEKTYYVRTVFQIRQKPGTYKIQGNTIHPLNWDPKVCMDYAFSNDELEWYTTDSSTVIPVGLLLHFSEVPIVDVYKKWEEHQQINYPEQKTFQDSRNLVQLNFNAAIKMKILWVDDYPPNNDEFIRMIKERGVEVDLCLSTDSAVDKVLEEGSDAYWIAITDMRRTEQRKKDSEPKVYDEAGLEFIRIAKGYGWKFPIYLYSSYARTRQDIMHEAKKAGAEKICTCEDMKYIIEENV